MSLSCNSCEGTGYRPGSSGEMCSNCHGDGVCCDVHLSSMDSKENFAVCGALDGPRDFTNTLQRVTCTECLYEVAWLAIDRARKLGGE